MAQAHEPHRCSADDAPLFEALTLTPRPTLRKEQELPVSSGRICQTR